VTHAGVKGWSSELFESKADARNHVGEESERHGKCGSACQRVHSDDEKAGATSVDCPGARSPQRERHASGDKLESRRHGSLAG